MRFGDHVHPGPLPRHRLGRAIDLDGDLAAGEITEDDGLPVALLAGQCESGQMAVFLPQQFCKGIPLRSRHLADDVQIAAGNVHIQRDSARQPGVISRQRFHDAQHRQDVISGPLRRRSPLQVGNGAKIGCERDHDRCLSSAASSRRRMAIMVA